MKPKKEYRYKIYETMNLTWTEEEIQRALDMVNAGECRERIARLLQRREEEIDVLMIDVVAKCSQFIN